MVMLGKKLDAKSTYCLISFIWHFRTDRPKLELERKISVAGGGVRATSRSWEPALSKRQPVGEKARPSVPQSKQLNCATIRRAYKSLLNPGGLSPAQERSLVGSEWRLQPATPGPLTQRLLNSRGLSPAQDSSLVSSKRRLQPATPGPLPQRLRDNRGYCSKRLNLQ